MDIKFIDPIREATINVLSTMAMVNAIAGKPTVKQGGNPLGDVTSIIDLSGKDIQGSLAISFSKVAIFDITEKILGECVDNINDTVIDIVGELTNIITGNAKRLYAEQGMDFDLTRPTMMIGNDTPLTHSVEGKATVLPFNTDAGVFYLELCFI